MRYLIFLLLIGCPDESSHSAHSTRLQISGIPDENLELGSNLKIVVKFDGGQPEEIDGKRVTLRIDCDRKQVHEDQQSIVAGVATFPEIEITNEFAGVCLAKASLTDDYHFYYQVDRFKVGTTDREITLCQQFSQIKIHLGQQLSICEERPEFKLSPQCGDGVEIFHLFGPTSYPSQQSTSSSVVVVANDDLPDGCQLKIDNKYYPIQSSSTANPIKGIITEVEKDDNDRIDISLSGDLNERRLYLSVDDNDWQELYGAGITSFSAIGASKLRVLVSETTDDYIWWDYYLKTL